MRADLRIVSQTPLEELWDDQGRVEAERVGPVTAERIKELLRAGEVSFVVADVGHAPRWISTKDAAVFWKAEVKNHLAEGDRFFLEDFPDGYALVASEWRRGEGCAVILLEAHH